MGYKVKRIMMWQNGEEKQIYPAPYKYSYDFRNKTVSQIQSDGWVTRTGSYSAGSSGIYTSIDAIIGFAVDCSNAKKIIMTGTANSPRASYGGVSIGLMTTVTTQTSDAGFGLYGTSNNPASAVAVYCNGSRVNGNDIGVIRPGPHTVTMTIDLVNKTFVGNVPNIGTSTQSLNDTQISAIKNMKGFCIYFSTGNTTTVTLSDVSITIY